MTSVRDFEKILLSKGYSKSTIRSYVRVLYVFQSLYDIKYWNKLEDKLIDELAYKFTDYKSASKSYQKHISRSISLFYKEMFDREVLDDYLTSSTHLPLILSKKEIVLIIEACTNTKQRSMLSSIYGFGLTVSELINLRVADIEGKENIIPVRDKNGSITRTLKYPCNLRILINQYIEEFKPLFYLFEGQGNAQYSPRSIQFAFKRALISSGCKKEATVHTLRHSYATHLIEEGVDVKIVQKLLGHKSIKTTQVYSLVANTNIEKVRSPFEQISIAE